MNKEAYTKPHNMDEFEVQEWLESLDSVLESSGPEVATEILERLRAHATVSGIDLPFTANTPYANTVPLRLEPEFPGDQEIERRIKSLIRWNAMAMVVRANTSSTISAGTSPPLPRLPRLSKSASTISSTRRNDEFDGDLIYFQGHASPGIYCRAFLEGRLTRRQLKNFRHELKPWRRAVLLSAPVAHARFLAVPHRLHGPRPDQWRSTRRASRATWKIAASSRRPTPRSGLSWATAKRTSPNPWAPSPWPRAKSSTT